MGDMNEIDKTTAMIMAKVDLRHQKENDGKPMDLLPWTEKFMRTKGWLVQKMRKTKSDKTGLS